MTEGWIKSGCVLVFLIWNACTDWKRKEIDLRSVGLFAVLGGALNLCFGLPDSTAGTVELILGPALGLLVLTLGFVTAGGIGFGDGLVLCVTGLYLGGAGNLRMFLHGTVLCAVVLGTGCALGKARWKDSFPLIPFLMAAYLGGLIWDMIN